MKGFKSFAKKTKIEFDNRITAVVGPNGSGKSNISDAVKWVLGEQSVKSLRGNKMEDVIFQGGENSSALNLCEVGLNFSNEDRTLDLPYDQVKISRRIYRNGDNEYKINDKKVRLKEIRELFLDTGLGKEGYSVIGQGKIEQIINSNPKERRKVFEEASGISKHKYRRDESEKKLDKVAESLGIIENEWIYKKKDLDALNQQKNNYDNYQKLTKEEDFLAYCYYNKKSQSLIENKKNIDEKIKIEEEKSENLKKESDRLNSLLLPFQRNFEELSEKLSSKKVEKENLEKDINKNSNSVELDKQNLSYKNKDLERNNADKSKSDQKLFDLESKLKEKENSLEETDKKILNLKDKLENFENEKEDLRSKKQNILLEIEKNEAEKKAFDQKLYDFDLNEKTKIALREHKKENDKKTQIKLAEFSEKLKVLNESLNKEDIEIKKISQDKEETASSLLDLQEKIKTSNEKLNKLRQNLDLNNVSIKETISNYKIQKDLLDKNEGYSYYVQEFFKETKKNNLDKYYLDSLANLIEVKDGYEAIIDILLGSSLQNIVTKNKEDSKNLINFVNKKRLGRLTFLPIDSIYGQRKPLPNCEEALAMAYELISFDENLSAIVNHFLGSTVLVKNIDDAISLSSKIKGYRIITMDLDLINTWGSMVAGKNDGKRNNKILLNRSKKIEEIKRRLGILKSNKEKIETEGIEEKKQFEIFEDSKIKFENIIKDLDKELEILKTSKAENEFERKSILDRQAELRLSLEEILENTEDDDIDSIRKNVYLFEKNLESLNKENNENKDLLNKLEKDLILLNNDLEIKKRDKSLLENRINEDKEEISNIDSNSNFAEKVKISLEEEIKNLNISIANNEEKNRIARDKINALSEEILNLDKTIKAKESDNKLLIENASKLSKQTNEIDINLVKLSYEKEAVDKDLENLEDEIVPYISKDLDVLSEDLKDDEIIPVKKGQLVELSKKIGKIGYFSSDSLSTFEKAKEDFEFLDKQKNDLENSKADIEKLIQELENEMKDVFDKNFEIINQNFQKIFKRLFMGGSASLNLDENDKLTCGIEISACPPGKSRKSISLLSGGEKSLTAVALLFAIFEANPSPFALLDEIDASMDEANIKRYIDYLKSLSENTQFIMITHRQTTMQLAEKIHGVTIGDDGISKIYSIDFGTK